MATKAKVRDDVVYYVDQGDGTVKGYLGTKPFVGGGGGTIENAALTNLQFDYTSTHDPITVFQTAGVPAYYGGIPARLIVQGQPVLFNVPYEDIKPEDTTSDYTYVSVSSSGNKGDEMRYVLDITEVTATTVTVGIKGYDVTTGNWNSSYSTTSTFEVEDLSECSFGICRNCATIARASTAYQKKGLSYSISGWYRHRRDGSLSYQLGMYVVGFQGGSPMVPTGSTGGGFSPTIYGFSDDEWFYNTGLAQRYEVIE